MTEMRASRSDFRCVRSLSALRAGLVLGIVVFATCVMVSRATRATPGEILVITGMDVALRTAPDAKSRLIERLDTNDRIMEFERRDGWVRGMLFGAIGKEGWVAERYLEAETDGSQDGVVQEPSGGADKARPDMQAAPTPSQEGGGPYVTRSRTPVYLYCLDCGLKRRHDARARRDHPHPEVREVPRRDFKHLEPSPVIRLVPRPAPAWGREPGR